MKTGKFPGVDNITADEIGAAGGFGVDVYFRLLTRVWNSDPEFRTDPERMVTLNHCSYI